jgi:50S ribosomal protein L16 3-hydroxylase
MNFTGFNLDHFLSHYWQKRPMLIRNPWSDWQNPLEPDELAGLACEAEVESRIVIGNGTNPKMESGPFPEARFGELGEGPWTLLVQAADHHVPDVAELITPFRFIPNWRIDDVMVSYATHGGGVGAHFDNYDVFLVQGLGSRRWRVGPKCDAQTPLLPHKDLRLIDQFPATDEWILEPGDILYVPPCFAHDGVAVGDDCMTYSIGFRAPSRAELIEGWCEHLAEQLTDDDRYTDPNLPPQGNPGEITAADIDRLHNLVLEALADRDAFARWFGQHNSLPKYDKDWRPEAPIKPQQVSALLTQQTEIACNPASRFSFLQQHDGAALLFVDGQIFECNNDLASLAAELCLPGPKVLDRSLAQSPKAVSIISDLINQGCLAFVEED